MATPVTQQPNILYFPVADTAAHSISGATHIIGFVNLHTAAQTANIVAYDNASAASGQVVLAGVALGTNGQNVVSQPGISLNNGLTVQASAAVLGDGFLVLYTTA